MLKAINSIIYALKSYDLVCEKFPFYVYAFEREDGFIYVGHTNLLPRRLIEHWFNENKPKKMLFLESFGTRREANLRENELMRKLNPELARKHGLKIKT